MTDPCTQTSQAATNSLLKESPSRSAASIPEFGANVMDWDHQHLLVVDPLVLKGPFMSILTKNQHLGTWKPPEPWTLRHPFEVQKIHRCHLRQMRPSSRNFFFQQSTNSKLSTENVVSPIHLFPEKFISMQLLASLKNCSEVEA